MKGKLFVFDLDATLWDGQSLYPDVIGILSTIRKYGGYIYVASFNNQAPRILSQLGILQFFHGGTCEAYNSKYRMIRQIIDFHNGFYLNYTGEKKFDTIDGSLSVYFYDDLHSNILDVYYGNKNNSDNIKAVHIINGLKWNDILVNL